MQVYSNILSKKEILSLNISKDTILGMDFQYINGIDCNFILFNGVRKLCFDNSLIRDKTFRKIKSIGLGWGWSKPLLTDEEIGMSQAFYNGENPFNCTIMCNNTSYNEVAN